ncbi:TM2 domain-containing protein [Polycladidibacter stylochi]|uniref:TM2 domain-containing protein n=1 Tax=Polycladidibacter stylochi TaxID=1807766 RepID=UPI00082D79B8|nr:TM2 domain-containing protein [Pseudovibrio stylochi]
MSAGTLEASNTNNSDRSFTFCHTCGDVVSKKAISCPNCGAPIAGYGTKVSIKKRTVAAVLCLLFGFMGMHRFYVGKNLTGLLMLLTFGGFFVWAFIDFVMILVSSFYDKEGLPLK